MDYIAPRDIYSCEVVVLSVQRWLGTCWVTIASHPDGFLVTFRPKPGTTSAPTEVEYGNALVEAAFLEQRARETLPLRQALLSRALSPYLPGSVEPTKQEP